MNHYIALPTSTPLALPWQLNPLFTEECSELYPVISFSRQSSFTRLSVNTSVKSCPL